MVTDLVASGLNSDSLDALMFGGTAAPELLPGKARAKFPTTQL